MKRKPILEQMNEDLVLNENQDMQLSDELPTDEQGEELPFEITDEALDEVSLAVESMNTSISLACRLHEVMHSAHQRGGISLCGAALTNELMSRAGEKAGLRYEPPLALENYNTTQGKIVHAKVCLESISDWLKKAYETIVTYLKKIGKWFLEIITKSNAEKNVANSIKENTETASSFKKEVSNAKANKGTIELVDKTMASGVIPLDNFWPAFVDSGVHNGKIDFVEAFDSTLTCLDTLKEAYSVLANISVRRMHESLKAATTKDPRPLDIKPIVTYDDVSSLFDTVAKNDLVKEVEGSMPVVPGTVDRNLYEYYTPSKLEFFSGVRIIARVAKPSTVDRLIEQDGYESVYSISLTTGVKKETSIDKLEIEFPKSCDEVINMNSKAAVVLAKMKATTEQYSKLHKNFEFLRKEFTGGNFNKLWNKTDDKEVIEATKALSHLSVVLTNVLFRPLVVLNLKQSMALSAFNNYTASVNSVSKKLLKDAKDQS